MKRIHTLIKPLIPEVVDDFLAKLRYASESVQQCSLVNGSLDQLEFVLTPGHKADLKRIEARFDEIAGKMTETFRSFNPKVLASAPVTRNAASQPDPHSALLESGEFFEYGNGRYGVGELTVRLMNAFDRKARVIAERLNAGARQFPSLIGADTLERCRYIRSFPHSLNLVSHLRQDLEAIQAFSSEAKVRDGHLDCNQRYIAAPECLLAPSICFHQYAWLADTRLDRDYATTALGKCFRWEAGNMRGLERLWDFTMREIIFMGGRDYVLQMREQCVKETVAFLDELRLGYEISSATDPFFIEDFAAQATFQLAFDLKFEIKADLPYRGKPLAVGSFNYHQDFFGKSFNIETAQGAKIHTGCVGFGLERLALAFYAQHGIDPARWPSSVRLFADYY